MTYATDAPARWRSRQRFLNLLAAQSLLEYSTGHIMAQYALTGRAASRPSLHSRKSSH
jgi:hypothetical protein